MIENYIPIFIMIGAAFAFGFVMGNVNELLGPRKRNTEKLSTYESGMEPVRSTRERFSVKYYLTAMLFIVFAVEIVFLYPWAVVFKRLGMPAFIWMTAFMAVLVMGLYYVWKKGALEWD